MDLSHLLRLVGGPGRRTNARRWKGMSRMRTDDGRDARVRRDDRAKGIHLYVYYVYYM